MYLRNSQKFKRVNWKMRPLPGDRPKMKRRFFVTIVTKKRRRNLMPRQDMSSPHRQWDVGCSVLDVLPLFGRGCAGVGISNAALDCLQRFICERTIKKRECSIRGVAAETKGDFRAASNRLTGWERDERGSKFSNCTLACAAHFSKY